MAIDRTGINSLDAGAPNLRLEGDIASIQAIPIELQKIILQYWIQQGDGSSADRIEDVPKEFRDNIIQLFRQQSSAQGGMEPMSAAQGGRAGYRDGYSVQGGVKNYLGDQKTVSDAPIKWQSGPDKPETELAYITKAEKDLILKKDLHGSLSRGPNLGPSGVMSLDSWGDIGGGGPDPDATSGGGGGSSDDGDDGDDGDNWRENLQHTYSAPAAPIQEPSVIVDDPMRGDGSVMEEVYAPKTYTQVGGDGSVMEEVYGTKPRTDYTFEEIEKGISDKIGQGKIIYIQDRPISEQEAYNFGLIQNDLETGKRIEGRNQFNEAGEIVPRTGTITTTGGGGGNGGDTTNAPVVTGGAAGPTGEVLKRDPYLDPNLMAASIPFETKNLEKLQFGPGRMSGRRWSLSGCPWSRPCACSG